MKPKREMLPSDRQVAIMADYRTLDAAHSLSWSPSGHILISFERPGRNRCYRRPWTSRRLRQLEELLWKATSWQLAVTVPTLGPIGFRTYIKEGVRIFADFDTCEKEND